jgi:hypothetical protein
MSKKRALQTSSAHFTAPTTPPLPKPVSEPAEDDAQNKVAPPPHTAIVASDRRAIPQRHGDRGSGDDDAGNGDDDTASAARYAAFRLAHQQRVEFSLPIFCRFSDLVEAGITDNWTHLLRLITAEEFPTGVMLSRNIRAWDVEEVRRWLAARPTDRKVVPPAKKPRRKRAQAKTESEAAA